MSFSLSKALAIGATAALMALLARPAAAVPSFARQTGLACEACHTVFPELTPFGRRFKLGGYTLTTRTNVSDIDAARQTTLSLQDLPPLSVMAQVSSTWWNKSLTDSGAPGGFTSQNGQTEFPQQLSLFYAGKIAENMGAFFQLTYQQASGAFSIDNSDIRLADRSANGDFVYGLTLNNNPSVQDVWNSTPAWGAPYFAPPSGSPAPAAAPLISSLGAQVGGLGAYLFYRDAFYLEATVYRSALQGVGHPYDSTSGNVIDGVAPYWRAAYERQWGKNALEVGTFGMWTKYTPTTAANATTGTPAQGVHPGNPDTYTDSGVDLQYQYLGEDNLFSLLGSYLHEGIDHNANSIGITSARSSTGLDRWQATASYFYRRKFGGSLGFTKETGSHDTVAFAPGNSLSTNNGFAAGSAKGKPDSQFETLELDYMPWLNTKILLQYTIYNQFNGGSNAYDGVSGRKASDNNTALIGLWIAF